ncbi:MAG TPA: TfoX/Sxy family protein [Polyangiaceae bacterium]|jgi:TfoX/Sxy family transcriptional regulator of competence genes
MAWTKVPVEHHPVFRGALPKDPRIETVEMFGGIAAKVNGNMFAALFGRSTMILLPEAERSTAIALEGAAWFDPMGDGRARKDKIMLPDGIMKDPPELRRWLARAFQGALALPAKAPKPAKAAKPAAKAVQPKKTPKSVAKKKAAVAKKTNRAKAAKAPAKKPVVKRRKA